MDRLGFDVSISYYDKPRYNAKHGIVRIAFSIECTSRLGSFVTYFIRDNKLFFIKDINGRGISIKPSGAGEILYQKQNDVARLKNKIGVYNLYYDSTKDAYYVDLNEKPFVSDNRNYNKKGEYSSFKDDIGEALSNSIIEDTEPDKLSTINEDLLIEIHGQLSNPVYALEDYCGSNEVSPILDVISVALINVLKHIEEEITKNERV